MASLNFNPFPVLETPRLILRRPLMSDAADLLEMRSDPQVMQYIPRPLAKSEEDVRDLLKMLDGYLEQNERINWAIEWKECEKVLGLIGYVNTKPEHSRAEVGYSLNRGWHRRGIMREALSAVLAYGFEGMQLHTIEAIIDANNIASGKLLEDAGFRREAFFREDFFYNGTFRNSIHYGLLQHEFKPARIPVMAG
jgi:ribosomal-protein-alanine N-acetyltransferase